MKIDKRDLGITLFRIVVGSVFLVHGSQKLFVYGINGVAGTFAQIGIPFPLASACLATFAEFFGGLAILLGLFTRLAAIPVAFTMLVAIATVHGKNGFFLPNGYEYALTLLVANIALTIAGGGAFALDNLVRAPRLLKGETAQPVRLAS
jgi:putative oxidoreductase